MTKEQIKEIRTKLGLSQMQFSKLLGVGIATVSRWELGISKPSNMAIEKLESYLDIQVNEQS